MATTMRWTSRTPGHGGDSVGCDNIPIMKPKRAESAIATHTFHSNGEIAPQHSTGFSGAA